MDLFDGLPDPSSGETASLTHKDETSAEAPPVGANKVFLVPEETSTEPTIGKKRIARSEEGELEAESGPGTFPAKKMRCEAHGRTLKGYAMEIQGERDDMEDAHCLMDHIEDGRMYKHPEILSAAYYAVFDGHAGRRASRFAADEFLHQFMQSFAARSVNLDLDNAITTSLTISYKALDDSFLAKASTQKPPWKDGTTATTALIVNNKAYLANVGDSKAVLCRFDRNLNIHKPVTLTVDHAPDKYEERIRIQQQGGRVKEGRLNGILEVSRSLGDLPYKKRTGLICTPSIQKCQITEDDIFIVIACDGLWKSLTPIEAINLVLESVKDMDEVEADTKYSAACSMLVKEAVKRLSGDNVTVLLIRICPSQPAG